MKHTQEAEIKSSFSVARHFRTADSSCEVICANAFKKKSSAIYDRGEMLKMCQK